MKTEQINIENYDHSNICYVERLKDTNGKIIPYVSKTGLIAQEGAFVKLNDSTSVQSAPVIVLLEAPMIISTLRTPNRPINFKTAVFMHKQLFVEFLKGLGKPDRTYLFILTEEGLYLQDENDEEGHLYTRTELKALGILSDEGQWNYREKINQWFVPDAKFPTSMKPTQFFLQDVGKIKGASLRNNEVWDMA